MKNPGALITFEGIDGCGKTTQLALAAEWLRAQGREVVATKEPGGTEVGRRIREIVLDPDTGHLAPDTELALMFAARVQHLADVIHSSIAAGKIVLCDRFTDSTVAYQGYGRGVPLERIAEIDRLFCDEFQPNLTLILDIDPEVGIERANSRNLGAQNRESRFEEEGLQFLRHVRRGYWAIAEDNSDRVRMLDARGNIEEVKLKIRGVLEEFLHGL